MIIRANNKGHKLFNEKKLICRCAHAMPVENILINKLETNPNLKTID